MDFDTYKEFKDFTRATLPEWESLTDEDITLERLSSLSNLVFMVTNNKNASPSPVIFRKFATKEGVVDREKEARVFLEMSKRGFGPKCYGGNAEYRLEEYFNARPIQNKEYNEPEFRRKLAISLAGLHKIKVKGVDKTPLFEKDFNNPQFYKVFEEKCDEKIYTPEEQKMIDEIRTASSEEDKAFIKRILPKDEPVFSHNDLLSGNILVRKDNNNIILIDYEYASFNFRGYDIGNMFKESTFDYTYPNAPFFRVVDSYFPSDDELKEFIQYYIAFTDMTDEDQKKYSEKFVFDYDLLSEYLEKVYKPEELKKRVENLYRETKIGVLLSHYYWMIWAIKMCKTPDSDFDYLTFSHTKFGYYKRLQEELKALDSSSE